ncbi:MAG TPA: TetR/AcrR family transcriptional regulator [Terriglobia bacterium]|nr:TetR/AcrR family transcriptional regulator [Terriglobia bacterium]
MPRHVDPVLTARRRAELIRAGYAEILARGIQGTTLDSVVERAGSSKGGALHYFPNKEDLLYAILEWVLSELDRSLEDVIANQETARRQLASELEVLFHSAEVNRKLYLVLFDYVAVAARSERFRSLLAQFLESCRRRDMAIVEQGIHEQLFRRVDPEDAAATIRALVDGYCLQWLMGPPDTPIEIYRDRCRAVLGSYLLRTGTP